MKDLNKFCQRYEAVVKPTHKMRRRANTVPYSITNFSDTEFLTVHHSDIPIVSIEIPEDRFRALLEHDTWLEKITNNNQNHYSAYDAQSIMYGLEVQHQKECILRNQYPALQKAWEQYQTTLALCGGGEK